MNNVQKLRKLYRLTQLAVSEKINHPKPLYAAFEHERYILPYPKLLLLAQLYNVSPSYLIEDMPEEIKERYKQM